MLNVIKHIELPGLEKGGGFQDLSAKMLSV